MPYETEESLRQLIEQLLGEPVVYNTDIRAFIAAGAFLMHQLRESIRLFPNIRDIDEVEESILDFLWREYAAGLPTGTAIPRREFIREAKYWYSAKSTDGLFRYVGDLTGTDIGTRRLGELILRTGDPTTLIGGELNKSPTAPSKLGRIRDGIRWAQYVYTVDVDQAQVLNNIEDFIAILNLIHPAGTMRFPTLMYKWPVEYQQRPAPQFLLALVDRAAVPASYTAGFMTLGLTDMWINPNADTDGFATASIVVLTRSGPVDLSGVTPVAGGAPQFATRTIADRDPVLLNHIAFAASMSQFAYDDVKEELYESIAPAFWNRTNNERSRRGILPRFYGWPMTHQQRTT